MEDNELSSGEKEKKPLRPARFVAVGCEGGVLNYVRSWPTEKQANADADKVAKAYGINPTPEELAKDETANWRSGKYDVYVARDDGTY